MTSITHKQYVKACLRLEELIKVVDDSTPLENPLTQEFLEVSNLIEQYEEAHYPYWIAKLDRSNRVADVGNELETKRPGKNFRHN